MNLTEFWTLALCICGAVQCLFLAACFGISGGKKSRKLAFLSLLMLLLGIRILKSVLYLLEGEEMSLLIMNIGFAAHLGGAAFLYLYIRSQFQGESLQSFKSWLHLFPALAIVLCSPWLDLDNFWYMGGYYCLLSLSMLYWGLAMKVYIENLRGQNRAADFKYGWFPALLAGTGIFFLAYFSNYILGLISYSTAPVIYSLAIFPIGISAWRNFRLILLDKEASPQKKYQNLSLSKSEFEQGKKVIFQVLTQQKAFLDPDFSQKELSRRTRIPPHVLSHILNQYLKTNFSNLINGFRIEEACRLLQEENKKHYTIAAIGFEVGFRSLSVFNHHFKKIKGTTPSAFRKQK